MDYTQIISAVIALISALVSAFLIPWLKAEKGIQFDVETIDKLIEAAVLQLHHELYGSERV